MKYWLLLVISILGYLAICWVIFYLQFSAIATVNWYSL